MCEETLVEPDLSHGLNHIPDSDEEFDEDDDDKNSSVSQNFNSNNGLIDGAPKSEINNDSLQKTENGISTSHGFISSIKLKRFSEEDSNFNGSSSGYNSIDDDDYHYLLSLHPYMRQLNASQKLKLRTKFQKLIFRELYSMKS